MKNKLFISIFISIFLIPQITFASWWNPITWFKFNKVKEVSEISNVSSFIETTSSSSTIKIINKSDSNLENENQKLKKELAEEENKRLKKEIASLKNKKEAVIVKEQITPVVTQTIPNVLSTTKTCLSGSIVSVNDFCIKICPDGEQIIENLNCKIISTTQLVKDICIKNHYTKSQINAMYTSKAIDTLRLTTANSKNRVSQSYDSDIASLKLKQDGELISFRERGIGASDVGYKSVVKEYENRITDLESSKQGLLNQADALYNDEALKIQVKGFELEQNSTEVACGL